MSSFRRGHALVIGVGAYQNPAWSAPITVTEAQEFFKALTDPQVSAYPPEQVTFLHDEQATRDGVTTALQNLAEAVSASDTVMLFFCGHGVLGTDGEYYFATREAVFTAENKIQPGTGLKGSEIISRLRDIEAQKLLFIVDACLSGKLHPTLGSPALGGVPPSMMLGVEVLDTGVGRAWLTASRPTQPSGYGSSKKLTHFGQALIEGMRGASGVANSDGFIGLYELYQYIYKRVTAATNMTQEPVLTILQGTGPFPVAHYPGATPGTLGDRALQQSPPREMAVEIVEKKVAHIVGAGGQTLNFHGSGSATIIQNKLIDFSGAQISGGVKMGDTAGGNIVKINISTTPAVAAAVANMQALLKQIDTLQADVTNLTDAPKGLRSDAAYALHAAREAGEEGDQDRLREKLEAAAKIVLDISATVPAAVHAAQIIGILLQQALRM